MWTRGFGEKVHTLYNHRVSKGMLAVNEAILPEKDQSLRLSRSRLAQQQCNVNRRHPNAYVFQDVNHTDYEAVHCRPGAIVIIVSLKMGQNWKFSSLQYPRRDIEWEGTRGQTKYPNAYHECQPYPPSSTVQYPIIHRECQPYQPSPAVQYPIIHRECQPYSPSPIVASVRNFSLLSALKSVQRVHKSILNECLTLLLLNFQPMVIFNETFILFIIS